jgi:hypothetical protein
MLDWAVDTESPKAGGPRTRGINGEAASLMRTQRYSYILSNVARLLLSKPVFWFFVSPNTPQILGIQQRLLPTCSFFSFSL